ncbi:MAG: hypothetical protein R2778_03600 [Saprospiraceae bacterium]
MRQTKENLPSVRPGKSDCSRVTKSPTKLIFQQPDSRTKSYDWRLDMVQPVQTGGQNALVIAVSSAHKSLKVAFVEYVLTITDFWPTDLLQKLSPDANP